MESTKQQENKENIRPSLTNPKQIRNPASASFAFHCKKKMKLCTRIPNRKPLRDITHLFNSSLLLQEALVQFTSISSSTAAPLLSPLHSSGQGRGSNPRKRKAPQDADAQLLWPNLTSKSLPKNFR